MKGKIHQLAEGRENLRQNVRARELSRQRKLGKRGQTDATNFIVRII